MNSPRSIVSKTRHGLAKLGPLLILSQRTPLGQFLFQEARVLGPSAFREVTRWSVALVAGLGAFDTVTGATVVTQVAPSPGSSTVAATNGSALAFVVQVTGAPSTAKSWRLTGTLPAGLTHANATNSNTDSVTGIPTQNGSFPITITAYEKAGYTGGSKAKSFTITVTGGATPPAISTHPAPVTIISGGTASLSVAYTGTTPTFQWYQGAKGDTANPVAGATTSSLTTPVLTASTSFWVRVTNAAGSVDSNAALVTVNVPPGISTHPAPVEIISGGTASLSVAYTGTTPTFQWYQGAKGDTANPVAGATTSSLTTPALVASTSFWVRVTNAAGSVDSNAALVTVIVPPGISTQPVPARIMAGNTAILSVVATGTSPAYQWYQGIAGDTSTPVSGATGAQFTTPVLASTTSYWCRVSNNAGNIDSQTATVTVTDTFSSWSGVHFTPAELLNGEISGAAADADRDGLTNEQEFIFGSSPRVPGSGPAVTIAAGVSGISLTFSATAASGPGYAGLIRHFALEASPTMAGGTWTAVTGFTDIVASGQTVAHSFTADHGRFFRLRTWLAAP